MPIPRHDQAILPPEMAPAAVAPAPELAIDTGDVHIEGAFPEMGKANDALVASIAHRHVTLKHLFEAGRLLEQAYARAGFVLVRVSVPPQRLTQGAAVRVVVTDGFIESIDLSHLAMPIRHAVRDRMAVLTGRRHVLQAMIERALLLAGDLPGARLRSAIVPGTVPGGVRLVIEGQFDRAAGQLGADNALPDTLGRWQVSGNVSLNNLLGLGDQVYITAGSQIDIGAYGFPKSPLGMLGGGLVLPVSEDGVTLTGEYLVSRTQPYHAANVPQTLGVYTRAMFRLRVPELRTHAQTLAFTGDVEIITQSENALDFGTPLSRDHYTVARLGANWQRDFGAAPVTVDATLSQGLDGREGTSALATSRQYASPEFTNLEGTIHVKVPVIDGFALDVVARGKTGFGKPQFLSEQFALDATNAVSSFPGGSFAVDSGATLRGELIYPSQIFAGRLAITPYVFGAGGVGWLARPTAVEQDHITAGALGVGGRIGVEAIAGFKRAGISIGIEVGHQFSNVVGRSGGERGSITAGLRF